MAPREIWFTTTRRGQRQAWFWGFAGGRAFRMPLAEAELLIAEGKATECSKPEWVGRR